MFGQRVFPDLKRDFEHFLIYSIEVISGMKIETADLDISVTPMSEGLC